MKYRKKPVVIEAFEYDGDLKGTDGNYYVPVWAVTAFENNTLYYAEDENHHEPCDLFVSTLEGNMKVSIGDFVIQGVNGELYPCKPDIFEKSYELVED